MTIIDPKSYFLRLYNVYTDSRQQILSTEQKALLMEPVQKDCGYDKTLLWYKADLKIESVWFFWKPPRTRLLIKIK